MVVLLNDAVELFGITACFITAVGLASPVAPSNDNIRPPADHLSVSYAHDYCRQCPVSLANSSTQSFTSEKIMT